MDGKFHAVIGAGTGVAVAQTTGQDAIGTAVLLAAGMVASLAPDLDTAGKLANKISLSHKMIQGFVRTAGILLGGYALLALSGAAMYIGLALGVFLLLLAPKFSQRLMLLVSGIAIIAAGIALEAIWAGLAGLYVVIASIASHRGCTHSLIGLLFFGVITFYIHEQFQITGLCWTLMLAYLSHLLADMRFIPGNKRGIKLFWPLSRKAI
ncbi:hypothetical protein GCM10028778_00140 [Barrientosiimonas marina]|uniref:Metal-dependent hydrolase n=1 Tax=Lentibacillus kimchii TaxID=1542911 RepID=A0ABW2URL0_9BACI